MKGQVMLEEKDTHRNRSIEDVAILELVKTARIMKRQMKIMRPLGLSRTNNVKVLEIIQNMEDEFKLYKL